MLSNINRCMAGVPQGSPLLFNIFIGETESAMPEDLRERVCDWTVYERVPANAESSMQRVLDNLQSWEISKSMRLNSKKTKDVVF